MSSDSSVSGTDRPHRTCARTAGAGESSRSEVILSAIATAAAVVLLSARLTGIPAFTPFPQILAFYPLAAAVAGVIGVVAIVRRTWVMCACMGLTALMITVTSWPPSAETDPAPDGSPRVRVVSSNVNIGAATQHLLDRLAADPVPADVVFIAECNANCARILTEPPAIAMFPHRLVIAAEGAAGSAILSRTALSELPQQSQAPGQLAMPTASVELGGQTCAVKAAHPFPPLPSSLERWRSGLDEIEQFRASTKSALIIGGDFNATPYNSEFRAILGDRLYDALPATPGTWPSDLPPLLSTPIDHILFSEPFAMSASGTWVIDGTDHRVVWADLWIRNGSGEVSGHAATAPGWTQSTGSGWVWVG